MKAFAESFYNSKQWKDCRASYKKNAGGLCERCKAKGIIKPGEIVHHKKHLTPNNIDDPRITLSFDNLELLCRECHADEHTRQARRYFVSSNGKIISKD